MKTVLRELRLVVRTLFRYPWTTVPSVLILGLGMGAAVVILTLVDAVLIRPLPYPEPGELVVVRESSETLGVEDGGASAPEVLDWRRSQESFEDLVAYSTGGAVTLVPGPAGGGSPRRAPAAHVGAGFFELFGGPIVHGRSLLPEDDRPGAEPVAVVSHRFWTGDLGADPEAIGEVVRFDEGPVRVVGVARPGFGFPGGVELWMPLMPEIADALSVRGARFLQVLGRLEDGVTPARAAEDLTRILAGAPESEDWEARVVPLARHLNGDVRRPLWILLGAVGVLVLIAAANTGNLLLVRAAGRRRELAVRAALGASRARLLLHLLAESVLLALAGGLLGLVVAGPALEALMGIAPRMPDVGAIGIDGRVLLCALGVALATGLLAGLLPAVHSSRFGVAQGIQEGGLVMSQGRPGRRLRRAFAVGQVALTFALLAGSGLLVRSYVETVSVDPGFHPERVHTFDLSLPTHRYGEPAGWRAFYQGLSHRIGGLEAVEAVAFTRSLPISGRSMTSPVVVDGSLPEGAEGLYTQVTAVSPGYFEAMGIPVLAGRAFTGRDRPGSLPVAVVNQAFVRTFLGGGPGVGARAHTHFGEPVFREIVGVVSDVKHGGLTEKAPPKLYTPFAQDPSRSGTLVVRSPRPPRVVEGWVRELIFEADPTLPLGTVATMEERLAGSVRRPRFYTLLLTLFASLALLLSTFGLYAITAEAVAERRHEIAIRMVLGSMPGQVLARVLGEGLALAAAGVALGLVGALAAGRVLESLLFRIEPTDPVVLVAVAILLAAVTALACLFPARRAARTSPSRILARVGRA